MLSFDCNFQPLRPLDKFTLVFVRIIISPGKVIVRVDSPADNISQYVGLGGTDTVSPCPVCSTIQTYELLELFTTSPK